MLARVHRAALTPAEQRVLGCLLEKRWTTPEQYPLSLNALRFACRPGQKEERFYHLLGEDPGAGKSPGTEPAAVPDALPAPPSSNGPAPAVEQRVARLESEVAELRRELAELRSAAPGPRDT